MTEAVPALRVHMVMIGVTDIARSVAFYTEQLGLRVTSRFEDFAFLDGGGISLGLSGGLAQARPPSGLRPVEIVLAVEWVGPAYDALRERGVSFTRALHTVDGTHDVANFADPDGHEFSIYGLP